MEQQALLCFFPLVPTGGVHCESCMGLQLPAHLPAHLPAMQNHGCIVVYVILTCRNNYGLCSTVQNYLACGAPFASRLYPCATPGIEPSTPGARPGATGMTPNSPAVVRGGASAATSGTAWGDDVDPAALSSLLLFLSQLFSLSDDGFIVRVLGWIWVTLCAK